MWLWVILLHIESFLQLVHAQNVECKQELECFGGNMTSIDNAIIKCEALGSCANSRKIDGNNTYIDCMGRSSCQNVDIISVIDYTSYVRNTAGGYLSSSYTNILNTSIQCQGELSCYNINIIKNAETIYCDGYKSCYNSIFYNNIRNIFGTSLFSLSNTIIYSSNTTTDKSIYNPDLQVSFYSFYSGFNSTIICNNNDYCTVNCEGNGCTNVNFICFES